MEIDWWTLGLQVVNFVILVWLLHHFLYRPVLGVIDARKEDVEETMREADQREQELERERDELEEARDRIEEERRERLAEAREQAHDERDDLLEEAEREADQLKREARQALEREREEATDQLEDRAAGLAVDLSARMLREVGADDLTERFFAHVDDQLRSLDPSTLETVRDRATDGDPVVVATAEEVDDRRAEQWRRRLRDRLDTDVDVRFEVDPSLIGGVEVRLPGGTEVAYNWHDMLERAREELRT